MKYIVMCDDGFSGITSAISIHSTRQKALDKIERAKSKDKEFGNRGLHYSVLAAKYEG